MKSIRIAALRTVSTLALTLTLIASLAPANAGEVVAPATTTINQEIPWGITGSAGGTSDDAYGGVELLFPLWFDGDTLLFLYPEVEIADKGRQAYALGLGLRQYFEEWNAIAGISAFWDITDSTYDNTYNGFGLSAEILTQWVDARLNWYTNTSEQNLVDSQKQSSSFSSTSSSTSYGAPYARDYSILQSTSTTTTTKTTSVSQTFEAFEAAMDGLDAEAGVLIPYIEDLTGMQLRAFGGYYTYDNPFGEDVQGFKARAELRVTDWLTADLAYYEDKELFGGNVYGGARIHFPLGKLERPVSVSGGYVAASTGSSYGKSGIGKSPVAYVAPAPDAPDNIAYRLTENIIRTPRIITADSGYIENESKREESTSTTRKTTSGTAVVLSDVAFVNNDGPTAEGVGTGSAAGNGTAQRPLDDIQDAINLNTRNVFVQGGGPDYNGNYGRDGGRSLNLYGQVPAQGGYTFGGPVKPVVNGTISFKNLPSAGLNAFTINTDDGHSVVLENVRSSSITNNMINNFSSDSDDSGSGNAIDFLFDNDGGIVNAYVANNMVTGGENGFFGEIGEAENASFNFQFVGNQFMDADFDGVHIESDAGLGSDGYKNINVSAHNNLFEGNGDEGLSVEVVDLDNTGENVYMSLNLDVVGNEFINNGDGAYVEVSSDSEVLNGRFDINLAFRDNLFQDTGDTAIEVSIDDFSSDGSVDPNDYAETPYFNLEIVGNEFVGGGGDVIYVDSDESSFGAFDVLIANNVATDNDGDFAYFYLETEGDLDAADQAPNVYNINILNNYVNGGVNGVNASNLEDMAHAIANFQIHGNQFMNLSEDGIYLDDSDLDLGDGDFHRLAARITNNVFEGISDAAVEISSIDHDSDGNSQTVTQLDVEVTGNRFLDNGYDVYIDVNSDSDNDFDSDFGPSPLNRIDVAVNHNSFTNTANESVAVMINDFDSDNAEFPNVAVEVIGNTFLNNRQEAIIVEANGNAFQSFDLNVSNNHITPDAIDSDYDAIFIDFNDNEIIGPNPAANFLVANNFITGAGWNGINFQGTGNVDPINLDLINNRVQFSRNDGITVTAGSDDDVNVNLLGNTSTGNGGNGIYINSENDLFLRIENTVASNNGSNGAEVYSGFGDIRLDVTRSQFNDNGNSGLVVTADDGEVYFDAHSTEFWGNSGDGFQIEAEYDIYANISNVTASDNGGEGGDIDSYDGSVDLTINYSQFNGNEEEGLEVDAFDYADFAIYNSQFNNSDDDDGLEVDARLGVDAMLYNVQANGNDDSGAEFASTQGNVNVTINQSQFNGNDDENLQIEAGRNIVANLSNVQANGSYDDEGIEIDADGDVYATLNNVDASGNGNDGVNIDSADGFVMLTINNSTFNNNGLFDNGDDRDGLYVEAYDGINATLNNVQANGNGEDGADFYSEDGPISVEVDRSTFSNNGQSGDEGYGLIIESDGGDVYFDAHSTDFSGNYDDGLYIYADGMIGGNHSQKATITSSTANDNAIDGIHFETDGGNIYADFSNVTTNGNGYDADDSGSEGSGIILDATTSGDIDAAFSNVTSNNNFDEGIDIREGRDLRATFSRVTVMYNGDDGIDIDNERDITFLNMSRVNASYNGGDGVDIENSGDVYNAYIGETTLNGNGENGIEIEPFGDFNGSLYRITANGNGDDGLNILPAGDFNGNISNVTAMYNDSDGAHLEVGNFNGDFVWNNFSWNGDDGVEFSDVAGNFNGSLSNNVADGNVESGIYADVLGNFNGSVVGNRTNYNQTTPDEADEAGLSIEVDGSFTGPFTRNTAIYNTNTGIFTDAGSVTGGVNGTYRHDDNTAYGNGTNFDLNPFGFGGQ